MKLRVPTAGGGGGRGEGEEAAGGMVLRRYRACEEVCGGTEAEWGDGRSGPRASTTTLGRCVGECSTVTGSVH